MKLTEDELIYIWRYFQYCCLPSIVLAKYAYLDYIKDIKEEKVFYRHGTKYAINRIGRYLELLPNRLMDVSNQNVRYMNILADNVEEQFEDEAEELHKAIFLTFRNAKWEHVECLTALHFILAMLRIAEVTFIQCCKDLKDMSGKDMTEVFHLFNIGDTADRWEDIVKYANDFLDTKKKAQDIDLNNIRCTKAIETLRGKLADIETLRIAMKKSYPWSPNYKEEIPYEQSEDYLIVNNNNLENNGMD